MARVFEGLTNAGLGPGRLGDGSLGFRLGGGDRVRNPLEVTFEAADDHGGIGVLPFLASVGQLDVRVRDAEPDLIGDGGDGLPGDRQ